MMNLVAIGLLIALALSSCSTTSRRGSTQMFPDCTQVSAEEQINGNCMHRNTWSPTRPRYRRHPVSWT